MDDTRARARLGGLLYFSTHITSVLALVFYGTTLTDPFSGSDSRIQLAVLLDVLLALGCIGTAIVLFPILRPHGESLTHTYSALRITEAAVILAGTLPMLALLTIRSQAESGLSAHMLVDLHQASFLIGQGLVISVNSMVIGRLLWTSGLVPRLIGALGMAGGALVLVGNLLQLFGAIEQGSAWAAPFALVVFAFEISLAGYLVTRGILERDGSPLNETG